MDFFNAGTGAAESGEPKGYNSATERSDRGNEAAQSEMINRHDVDDRNEKEIR